MQITPGRYSIGAPWLHSSNGARLNQVTVSIVGPGVRDDGGAYEGADVPIYYDSLISKLITWGEDRPQALARMRRALAEYEVRGIRTTLPFFQWVLSDADFIAGRFDTGFIDRKLGARNGQPLREPTQEQEEIAAIAAALSHTLRALDESSGPKAQVSKWAQLARADALRTATRSLA